MSGATGVAVGGGVDGPAVDSSEELTVHVRDVRALRSIAEGDAPEQSLFVNLVAPCPFGTAEGESWA